MADKASLQHLIRKEAFELRVLVLQRLQFGRIGHFHAAILGFEFNGMDVSPSNRNAVRVSQQIGERDDDSIHGDRFGQERVPASWCRF